MRFLLQINVSSSLILWNFAPKNLIRPQNKSFTGYTNLLLTQGKTDYGTMQHGNRRHSIELKIFRDCFGTQPPTKVHRLFRNSTKVHMSITLKNIARESNLELKSPMEFGSTERVTYGAPRYGVIYKTKDFVL